MHNLINEDLVEKAALAWLESLNIAVLNGADIGPDTNYPERDNAYTNTVLERRLQTALRRLNPELPSEALDDAYRQLTVTPHPTLIQNNRHFHRLLVNGIDVTFQDKHGERTKKAYAINWDQPEQNDWLAVDQFTVRREGTMPNPEKSLEGTRRPDIVIFCNGLPLVIIELKNAASESASALDAFHQLQTYKHEIGPLFYHNAVLVISDGSDSRLGTLTSPWEWFKAWKTIDGSTIESQRSSLETLIKGALAPQHLLELMRHFTVFEERRGQLAKKTALYHQYHAVQKAIERTRETVMTAGDQSVGVIWHTQGSGKSLSMLFYAAKISRDVVLRNPTLVVLTDRNDLDDQLYDTFTAGRGLLGQTPYQIESRSDLRKRLKVASGGILFTTIQKFSLTDDERNQGIHPLLSERENIVFIVDEAHRSQYGFEIDYEAKDNKIQTKIGFAQHMRDALPNAAFIGFTGTPIEIIGRSTLNVFGDYIDKYILSRAVADEATVPIYYEARHAKIDLPAAMVPQIDSDFTSITAGEDEVQRERLRSKFSRWKTIVTNTDRLALVANDIVAHFEERNKPLNGKGMIVSIDRATAATMYNLIAKLRPDWVGDSDNEGLLKVVISGTKASDKDNEVLWPHLRSKRQLEDLAERFRDPSDNSFKLVIVCDMWLTGFDAPSLHTMYIDKPMQGHNLMQAIARVNRVYPDKEGGLIVSYLPLQESLQEALKVYDEEDRDEVRELQTVAVALMQEKYEVVRQMFHGFDYLPFFETDDPTVRLTIFDNAKNFILEGRDKKRDEYIRNVTALSKAYMLANPHEAAVAIRREVGFFNAVKAPLIKTITVGPTRTGKTPQELDQAVQQIVDNAIAPDEVVPLSSMVNLPQQDISILSDEFLQRVNELPQRNLAVELLERLLNDEINVRRRQNLIQSQSFAEKLQEVVRRYNQGMVTSTDIINELIDIAKEMRAARARGEELGLTDDELAFYDALEVNDSAVAVLGEPTLKEIAQVLVQQVKKNISIDWELREDARARMRVIVKRILRKYGYPPDKQVKATQTVVAQAELLSQYWMTY